MQVQEALAKFVVQLEADGRSPHTVAQYRRHVSLFQAWLGAREIEEIDHEDLAAFLRAPVACCRPDGREKKATAMNALRSSLRCFFGYLHAAGYTRTNPARLIRRARCGASPPRGLRKEDQKLLLTTLAQDDGGRDSALFHLMLATGIRVGSAVGIHVEDVDIDAGQVLLRRSKGSRMQVVLLGTEIREHLRTYLRTLDPGPLFPGRKGKAIGTRHANRLFHRWLRRSGITRQATAHSLRHAFALNLYEKTKDIALVQRALGHRSIASTLVYARVSDERLRAALG